MRFYSQNSASMQPLTSFPKVLFNGRVPDRSCTSLVVCIAVRMAARMATPRGDVSGALHQDENLPAREPFLRSPSGAGGTDDLSKVQRLGSITRASGLFDLGSGVRE